jgi:hypothetical protein
MKNLIPQADVAVILDNSTEKDDTLVAFGHTQHVNWVDPVPGWAEFLRG